jgi:GNAT superfamily N-acetyltransferase
MATSHFKFVEGDDLKLEKYMEALDGFSDLLTELGAEGRHRVKNTLDDRQQKRLAWNDRVILEAVFEDRAIAIKVHDKLAAFGGFTDWEQTLNGRKIYMITKVATLPEFEGRGFSKAIIQRAKERILETDPNAYVLIISKEDRIKKQCIGNEWRRSTVKKLLEECGQDTRSWDFLKKEEDAGYEAFLLDPKKIQTE